MTPLSCEQLEEVADELCLEALTGDARGRALEHLERCGRCRAMIEALSEAADQLLFAHPALGPPPGFEDRVLARLAAERTRLRARPSRARVALAAAAAVLVLATGAGLLGARAGGHGETGVTGSHELRTVQLISATGGPVGDVSGYSGYAGRPAWFFMQVDGGVPTATYQCVLDVDGGRSIPIGTLTVTGGKGAWGEHLAVDARTVRRARLVAPGGAMVATATLS